MSTVQRIMELLEQGYTPSELVKMGYPRSTVYYAYRKYRERKSLAQPRKVYVAYDTANPEKVDRLRELLGSMGMQVIVGPLRDTIEISRLIESADIVLGIADKEPSLRHQLFVRELAEAERFGKKTIVVAEKGAEVNTGRNVLLLTYSDDLQELKRSLAALTKKLQQETHDNDIVNSILTLALAGLAAVGLAILIAAILDIVLGIFKKE